uniref:Venom S1 protease 21 n=1 Tax=Oncocephalus sp. TaxID=2944721 RepID=A0AB38ZEL7_9HEMI
MNTYSWALILIWCSVTAHAASSDITMKTGEQKRLTHKTEDGLAETTWNLETCEGCRFIVSCYLYNKNCDEEQLIVFDGNRTTKECGPRFSATVIKNSVYNKMSITFKTKGHVDNCMCHVSTTKPYTNTPYEPEDSAEHGLGTGATKQPTCKCGWANKSPARIVGGHEVAPNQYPFVAYFKIKHDSRPLCGATIISPYHLLTAAHCTSGFEGMPLVGVVGDHDVTRNDETAFTQEIEVEQIINHENYDNDHLLHDIAIIVLKNQINFNDAVGPVCLPSARINLDGKYAKFMGWGNLRSKGQKSPVLRHVTVKGIPLDICSEVYRQGIDLTASKQHCTWAPGRDSCQGDSGGPLVWVNPEYNLYKQVGIVSFGSGCASMEPGVTTDVSYFKEWIEQVVARTKPHQLCE